MLLQVKSMTIGMIFREKNQDISLQINIRTNTLTRR
uniref:Uncharacterized protein n=1 Tax=virus sp. ctx9V1 TaxID=2828001 RepID=A0A8S5RDT8_9VIRU|nr:MAG TPA: hypothetical protein [virus sp. ctx9V1]